MMMDTLEIHHSWWSSTNFGKGRDQLQREQGVGVAPASSNASLWPSHSVQYRSTHTVSFLKLICGTELGGNYPRFLTCFSGLPPSPWAPRFRTLNGGKCQSKSLSLSKGAGTGQGSGQSNPDPTGGFMSMSLKHPSSSP